MRNADYVARRIAIALVTALVAVTLNFVIFRAAPGTAVSDLSQIPGATPALRQSLNREFGLDKSKWEQYGIYLVQLAHGNLGRSYQDRQPVLSDLGAALANTVPMVALGVVAAILLGILTGALFAWRRGTRLEQLGAGVTIVLFALPGQWLGLMLLIVFAGVLPPGGMTNDFLIDPSFWVHAKDVLVHMALPALTLAVALYGGYTLIVRAAVVETLGEDYILTARAKGLRARTVLRRYALRNAMLPITTHVALSLSYIVTGATLVEVVFSWPGIGRAIYGAATARDYPLLQGAFLLLTLSVVFCNLVVDLLYLRLDPRVTE